jgi:hypothetical protein
LTEQKPSDGPEFKVPAEQQALDEMIVRLGADKAPRVTPDKIAAKIRDVLYHESGDGFTICRIILRNGFSFLGHSAPASSENYNKEIGRKIAYDNAFRQIWSHEGYLLKEMLHQAREMQAAQANLQQARAERDPTDSQAAMGHEAHE